MSILIPDVSPRVHYTATLGQTVFEVPFPWVSDTHLKVWVNGNLTYHTVSPPTENWMYSTTGVGLSAGGSITFGPPGRAAGQKVVIIRDMPIARVTDLPTSGVFPVEALNLYLDASTAMIQQTEVNVQQRTLRLVDHDEPVAIDALPLKADRANKHLKFDADGQPIGDDIQEALDAAMAEIDADRIAAEAAAAAAAASAAAAAASAAEAASASSDISAAVDAGIAEIEAASAAGVVGIENATAAGIAEMADLVVAAEAAASLAAASLDGIMKGAGNAPRFYPSTGAGLADTSDGDFFWVYTVATDSPSLYRNDAGVATPVEEADAAILELVGDRSAYMAMDFLSDGSTEIKVVDPVTPANDYSGDAFNWFTGTSVVFWSTRLCLQQDGSFKYQDHNNVLQSEDFTNGSWAKNQMTAVGGVIGPDGTTANAFTLTVITSAANSSLSQNIAPLANSWQTQEYYVKKGTSAYCYIAHTNNAVTRRAYFNLTSGLFETVDAGLVARVSSTFPNGTPLASGWFRISAYGFSLVASDVIRLGLCNADNNVATTIGLTLFATRAHYYRGIRQVDYMPTTTVLRRDVPFDWTPGSRSVRLDIATNYRGRWSNDMTNVAWTKTSVTAALNAVGPDLEPCSTMSATAANGTVIQAVTSAGTQQTFHAWVRRKTGGGTLSLTIDNGATWTDVTADVGAVGGAYQSVYLKGVLANPTVGFKIGTSGDAFEVAFANVVASHNVPPPIASAAADVATSTDVFNVPMTKFPTAVGMTVYADLWQHPSAMTTATGAAIVGFFGAGSLQNVAEIQAMPDYFRLEHGWNAGSALDENFGDALDGRIQVQFRMKPDDSAICYNGNAAYWNHLAPTILLDAFKITFSRSLWLRRLLVVPEAISYENDDLRLFKLDASDINVNSDLLASAFAAKTVPGSTGILRIPGIEVLYESGDICGFITFWGQRNTSGYNLEAPQRIMSRKWEFNRATNVLVAMTDATVVYEPAGWAAGNWGVQGYTPLKIKVGPYRGRLVLIYIQQNQSGGSPDNRNLYMIYSDDNGNTWSSAVAIIELADFALASGFVATGENSTIFQVKDGTHEGRVYFSLNVNNQNHYAAWCDDYKAGGNGSGTAWSWSTTPVNAIGGGLGTWTEPAIAQRPNGNIVMVFRNSGGGGIGYSVSTDYGVTFPAAQLANGDNVSWNVNCGLIQDDPTGKFGAYGRLILARSTTAGRTGHKVQSATDAVLTWGDNYRVFSPVRFIGYSPLRKLFDDDNIYLIMGEVQPTGTSNVDTSQMLSVFRY